MAGYPISDVKVTLYDGSFPGWPISEIAFKIAGSLAFQDACKAGAVILEPIMKVEAVVPEEFWEIQSEVFLLEELRLKRPKIEWELRLLSAKFHFFVFIM